MALDADSIARFDASGGVRRHLDDGIGPRPSVARPRREPFHLLDLVVDQPHRIDIEGDTDHVEAALPGLREGKHQRVVVGNRPPEHQAETLGEESVGEFDVAGQRSLLAVDLVYDAHVACCDGDG